MIDFNELISNYLKREFRPKDIGRYYPSEAGNCLRKSWYSYKIPRDVGIELIKIFEVGNILHEFIADVLKSEKNPHVELLGKEVPFRLELDNFIVSGRIDDIISVKVDDKIYLVEMKSTSSINATTKPNYSHILQLQLYMHFKKINDGIILYIEKNTLQSKWFHVKYDNRIAEEAIVRFDALHRYLVAEKTPEPEARKDPMMRWQCDKCQYREECYKETPKSEEYP